MVAGGDERGPERQQHRMVVCSSGGAQLDKRADLAREPARRATPFALRRSAPASEGDREARVTAEEDAGPAHGRMVGVERNTGCSGEESLDRNAGLEAGKRRADAEVKTATEREVGSTARVIDVLMLARRLLRRWSVGSSPKQQYPAVCRDGYLSEACVVRDPSVVELERPVVAEDVLERFGNPFGVASQPLLEASLAGQRFRRVGDQAARGLGARREELQEESDGFVGGEHLRVDRVDEHGEQSRALS